MIKALIIQREQINQYGGMTDSLEKEYVDYFTELGFAVFPVSNFSNIKYITQIKWDLIILSGGGILSNESYSYCREGIRQHNRDLLEDSLLEYAVEKHIPVLGVCRGMHKINCFFNGKIQPFFDCNNKRVIGGSHIVLNKELNENFYVNNFHDDGIFEKYLGDGLIPLLVDPENVNVEAFINDGQYIAGIQWHPERLGNDNNAKVYVENLVRKITKINFESFTTHNDIVNN